MDRNCVVCHDKQASFRCIQCHKPVCNDCAIKTDDGAFCSRKCANDYREFRRAYAKEEKKKGGLLKLIVVLIILAALVYGAHHFGLLSKVLPQGQ